METSTAHTHRTRTARTGDAVRMEISTAHTHRTRTARTGGAVRMRTGTAHTHRTRTARTGDAVRMEISTAGRRRPSPGHRQRRRRGLVARCLSGLPPAAHSAAAGTNAAGPSRLRIFPIS